MTAVAVAPFDELAATAVIVERLKDQMYELTTCVFLEDVFAGAPVPSIQQWDDRLAAVAPVVDQLDFRKAADDAVAGLLTAALRQGQPSVQPSGLGAAPVVPGSGLIGAPGTAGAPPGPYGGPTGAVRLDPPWDTMVARFLAGDGIADLADQVATTRQRSSGSWKRARREVEGFIRDELRNALIGEQMANDIIRDVIFGRRGEQS